MRVAAGVLIVFAVTQLVSPLPMHLGELLIALALAPIALRAAITYWRWLA